MGQALMEMSPKSLKQSGAQKLDPSYTPPQLLTDHVITEVDLVRSTLMETNSVFDAGASGFDANAAKDLVDCLDTDRDGRVSYKEFIRGFSEKLPQDFTEFVVMVTEYEAVARHVRKMAMKMYQPQPAALEAMGLYTSGKAVRETLLQDVFSAFDLDNDGFVDSEELLQLQLDRSSGSEGWSGPRRRTKH